MQLPVDRNLINSKFNSYRLCVDVPWKLNKLFLPDSVQTLELNQNDYGYVHASMATNINGFFQDDSSGMVYFVTQRGRIMTFKQTKLQDVFHIPDYKPSTYASLSFISQNHVLVFCSNRDSTNVYSDLLILDRSEKDCWKLISILHLSENTKTSYSKPSSHFHLFNSGHEDSTDISFVFGSVHEFFEEGIDQKRSESCQKRFQSRFKTILEWITIRKTSPEGDWSVLHHRRLCDSGLKSDWPKYVSILDHQRIVVASHGRMMFKLICENGAEPVKIQNAENQEIIPIDVKMADEEAHTVPDCEFSNFQELEECDIQESFLIMSIFAGDSRLLKEYDLSSQQWLCTVPNETNPSVPYFVLRHDVDAFIYLLDELLEVLHVATFDAIGYIQASKTKKRFMTMKIPRYTIIGDTDTNVYLYWKSNDDENQGNHAIIQLESKNSILGLCSGGPDGIVCYVLTNQKLAWITECDSNQSAITLQ